MVSSGSFPYLADIMRSVVVFRTACRYSARGCFIHNRNAPDPLPVARSDPTRFLSPRIQGFVSMLSCDAKPTGRFVDVVWCDSKRDSRQGSGPTYRVFLLF